MRKFKNLLNRPGIVLGLFVVGMLVFAGSLATIRGAVQYHRAITEMDHVSGGNKEFQAHFDKYGFDRMPWWKEPTIKDYFLAGL